MSLTVQWIITGLIIAAAAVFLVLRLGWWRRNGGPPDPACGSCPGCSAAGETASRLAGMNLAEDSEETGDQPE